MADRLFDAQQKDDEATFGDMRRYMDDCWNINSEAMIDIRLLVEAHLKYILEQDPIGFMDEVAAKGSIALPGYIVELAKAAMQAAAAGAAFDEARCSFEEEILKPRKAKDKDAVSYENMTNRKPTLLGCPAVTDE